ncbi:MULTISPECIES: NADP-dependent oxidoreductase [unclassified Oceanispirochaeta]|uniref:NADP-dependent oxidoreductase n=1 Tax=unclassified Oceanispirochaeta TaxID=2635722 RepID=UPI000E08E2A2|nr:MULTISPECIES: NADP-dependent oxidoreductase [unclassified Oceanispirochaeta]MBF9015977.1 NADP-dependent oxidoreductase [Oceanispirochaeta sp. M2]NPD72440.1 NADP-dependent oxidoreductase [Oceanispirochaeta sp. M1]RDG31902.1 NADP-dependent oxidoreductase [Oceanispirochaeta sp. M1]
MKAAIIREYGQEVEITDIPKPELLADAVLVEVHSASINPVDNIIRAGYMKEYIPIKFPFIMGFDVSGVVVEVGSDVSNFKKGDEVYARPSGQLGGTIAEYAVINEKELALKPVNISHQEAASIPLAGLTAWQALVAKGKLQKGQKVLIHAGSGGVGTLAIQMAKQVGAYVASTTSTSNVEMVKKLGADEVIDYKNKNFEELLSDYDLVIDMMGGEILEKSFKVLKKGGTLVSIKGQDTNDLAKQYGVQFESFFMWPSGEMLSELAQFIGDGVLKPVIDRSYSIDETQKAYDYLQTGRVKGKVVIAVK